jgi:hypothetical protein
MRNMSNPHMIFIYVYIYIYITPKHKLLDDNDVFNRHVISTQYSVHRKELFYTMHLEFLIFLYSSSPSL